MAEADLHPHPRGELHSPFVTPAGLQYTEGVLAGFLKDVDLLEKLKYA